MWFTELFMGEIFIYGMIVIVGIINISQFKREKEGWVQDIYSYREEFI